MKELSEYLVGAQLAVSFAIDHIASSGQEPPGGRPLKAKPQLAHYGQAPRARIGRFGRQPAYWILRERRICGVTGQSSGYISMVLNGSMVPKASFIEAVGTFLRLDPTELFTAGLIEASRTRDFVGPPPSPRVGPYGRQPAYWMLRRQGIRQHHLGAVLGRSPGQVSRVLNGFILPDQRFVEAVSNELQLAPIELFNEDVLDANVDVTS